MNKIESADGTWPDDNAGKPGRKNPHSSPDVVVGVVAVVEAISSREVIRSIPWGPIPTTTTTGDATGRRLMTFLL